MVYCYVLPIYDYTTTHSYFITYYDCNVLLYMMRLLRGMSSSIVMLSYPCIIKLYMCMCYAVNALYVLYTQYTRYRAINCIVMYNHYNLKLAFHALYCVITLHSLYLIHAIRQLIENSGMPLQLPCFSTPDDLRDSEYGTSTVL